MVSFRTLFQLSSLAGAHAFPHASRTSTGIQWSPCNETEIPSLVPVECGNLVVPLDYTDPTSNRTVKLELVKVPVASGKSKGSIQLNFGGPGLPGRGSLASLAPTLQALTGGEYDLIAFDPRGTGNTIPFLCGDEIETVRLTDKQLAGDASDVSLGTAWAVGQVTANACLKNAGDIGAYINTAFVARDLMSVVDALDEDGMLRYWGLSYGTTLGATVASMFPDRIDKLILDGVQNPHEYYHAQADFEEWSQSDDVFTGFFETCVAAEEHCALYRPDVTAAELEQSVWDLIEEIRYRPLAVGSFLLDYTHLKGIIVQAFYNTGSWPGLAVALDMVLTDNIGDHSDVLEVPFAEALVQAQSGIALAGIHCSDRDVRVSSLDEHLPAVHQLLNTSRTYGGIVIGIGMTCAQWKIEPKERYQGDFQVETKNPILVISNSHDGHTPIASGRNVTSGFEGSVLLEVDGYGHCSTALPSTCTLNTVSDYWVNGVLPEPGTICDVDKQPFFNGTWEEVIAGYKGE